MKFVVMRSKKQLKVVGVRAPDSERTLNKEFFAGEVIVASKPQEAAEQYQKINRLTACRELVFVGCDEVNC